MLRSLRLLDFRCFHQFSVEAPAEGMIITGDNARGKTSILEAICLLVRLHSPRTHRMTTVTRLSAPGFGIAGDPWDREQKIRHTAGALSMEIDGEPRANQQSYLQDGGLVVWMGNEDLELIRGSGEVRRRYLDFLGSQLDAGYRRAWSRYRRALRAKNLLLKEGRHRDAETASYEEILVEHGTYLIESRARLIQQLSPLAAEAQLAISGKNEALTLTYLPASGPDLRQSILQARERETRLRQSVVGPHRDDVDLRLNGMPAADFASEGQQRTLALSLKLAQGKLLETLGGKLPLYLIDDVFGELDSSRRNALMNHLPVSAQKWVTTTHLDWLRETPALQTLARHRID